MAPLEIIELGSDSDGSDEGFVDAPGRGTLAELQRAAMGAENAAEKLRHELSTKTKALRDKSHRNGSLSSTRPSSSTATPAEKRTGKVHGQSSKKAVGMSARSSSTQSLEHQNDHLEGSSRTNLGNSVPSPFSTAQRASSNLIDDLSGFREPPPLASAAQSRPGSFPSLTSQFQNQPQIPESLRQSASATAVRPHEIRASSSTLHTTPTPRKRGRPPKTSYSLMSQPAPLLPRPSKGAQPQTAGQSFASSTSAGSQPPTLGNGRPGPCAPCRERHRKCSGSATNIWPCDLCKLLGMDCDSGNAQSSRPGPKPGSIPKWTQKPGRKPGFGRSCQACRQRKRRCSAKDNDVFPCDECRRKHLSCVPPRHIPAQRRSDSLERDDGSTEDEACFDHDSGQDRSRTSSGGFDPDRKTASGRRNPGRGTKRAIRNYYAEPAELDAQERSTSRSSTPEPKVNSSVRGQQRGPALQQKAETKIQSADNLPHFLVSKPDSSFNRLLQLRENCVDARVSGRAVNQKLQSAIEDFGLSKWRQLEGASKDIIVAEWSPNGRNYVVSTSTELDDTSRPYNKEKNFLWGDIQSNTLRELDDHHVRKARGETLGDRAISSNQQTSSIVDERLFTTVSSVCFSSDGKRMYSGSYDCTVKIWSTSPRRPAIKCKRTLRHEGRVEILSISRTTPIQALATAQSTPAQAISVFNVSEDCSTSTLPARQFSHDREIKNALYPAALRWGVLPTTNHLLLAGFAENNVNPWAEDRQGNLCLWDVEQGAPLVHLSPSSQNVFDVCWHPNLPILAAGTSPGGPLTARRTQAKSVVKTFHPLQGPRRIFEFDCPALDINEIQFHPIDKEYVCAACTDGRIYVWDARRPDEVLRILEHGPGMEPLDEQQTSEQVDTGVRFMAWSADGARLYTGSSDGVIKCWNPFVADEEKHVRDVAAFDSAVMSGAFSPDYTHLLVGLCKGAVHVLSSAPWDANQDCDSGDASASEDSDRAEPDEMDVSTRMDVPAIEYKPPIRSEIAKRHREAEDPAPPVDLRQDSKPTLGSSTRRKKLRREDKVLVSERGGGYRLYDNWDGPSTEEDSEPIFERGVSERELSELYNSTDESSGEQSQLEHSIFHSGTWKTHETQAVKDTAGSESLSHRKSIKKKFPVRDKTPTPAELPKLVKTEARTPSHARDTLASTRASSEATRHAPLATPKIASRSPATPTKTPPEGWRPIRQPPPPRSYLENQRASVQEQAGRAKARGNVVVLDDSDD